MNGTVNGWVVLSDFKEQRVGCTAHDICRAQSMFIKNKCVHRLVRRPPDGIEVVKEETSGFRDSSSLTTDDNVMIVWM